MIAQWYQRPEILIPQDCSGLINPDTDLGENGRHEEVSDERYNWIRPHQFNDGLAPAVAEEKLKAVSGIS
ncbi:hypothetical protein [Burkholderia gladioli]|uniref:hypothetical protein n=1 Tax=Burkholderia gladioli TaxID=28095 RepID=UPI00163E7A86|nr:hypothetical protein [Burkholderia gladioli]